MNFSTSTIHITAATTINSTKLRVLLLLLLQALLQVLLVVGLCY